MASIVPDLVDIVFARRRLPNRRWHFTQRFAYREAGGSDVFYELTVGFFPDGTVGELFMDGALDQKKVWLKVGSKMETILDIYAELASRLLQCGMRLSDLAHCGPPEDIWRRMIEVAMKIEACEAPKLAASALGSMRPLVRELPGILREGDPQAGGAAA